MPIKADENGELEATVAPAPGEPRAASGRFARLSRGLGLAGFALYALAAPHSIAVSWIGLSFAVLGWLARTLATHKTGLRRTPLDLPLWLFFAWTALSCFLSEEPRVSVPKLINVSTLLMFYLTQALVTRKVASPSRSGVERRSGLSTLKPCTTTPLREGDAVWRVNGG